MLFILGIFTIKQTKKNESFIIENEAEYDSQTTINVENKNIKQYTANSVAKEIYAYEDIIALNLGTEVEFINSDGWLVKRYSSSQVIKNIVLGDGIAGIVYRDKIELINL